MAEIFAQRGYNIELTFPTRDSDCDILEMRDIHGIPYMILTECKRHVPDNKISVQLVLGLLGVPI